MVMIMKKSILSTVLMAAVLLSAQMAMTVSAAESADDLILISPRPQTEQTGSDTQLILNSRYEQYAGMYSFDGVAEQLNSIEVLLGDGMNFNLDDLPDRQQASVMVVRMRGEEAEAIAAYEAGEITCPFSDVDNWAKPYVAWLYEKGITKGVGDNQFGNRDCTAEEYVTFMLRALGYTVTWSAEEGTDTLFADVLDYASDLHLWDSLLASEPEFNRGVMSAVTYQTLAADVKGTETRLLSALTENGAIDKEKAEPILALYDRIDAAAALELASLTAVSGGLKLTGQMVQDEYRVLSVTGLPEGDAEDASYSGLILDVGLDFTDGKSDFAVSGEMYVLASDMAVTVPMGMWMHDGTAYVELSDQKLKADAANAGDLEMMTSVFGDLSMMHEAAGFQYYAVSDVVVEPMMEEDITGTVIIYDMTKFMWPIAAVQLDMEGFTTDASLLTLVTTQKYFNETGVLSAVFNSMYTRVSETDIQSNITANAELLLETTVTYTAWGDEVTLTFPDFSEFVEISEEEV